MKNYHYILFFALMLFGYGCTDDLSSALVGPQEGLPATAIFSFSSSSNQEMTRAVASPEDEKTVHNLYVLVFDSDGKRTSGQFFEKQELENNKLTLLTKSGRKHVYGVANLNLDMMEMEVKALDAVATENALLELNSRLQDKITSRGDMFLMSGCIENAEGQIAAVDIHEGDNGLLGCIQLTRVDAKITFVIKTPENVSFIAKDWSVYNVPTKVSLFSREEKNRFQDPEDYFNTKWFNIEGEGDLKGKTFAFYVLENKHLPRSFIPATGLSAAEQFHNRERQEKDKVTDPNVPNQEVQNGKYIYAPALGTYVKLRGVLSYKASNGEDIIADVVYTVHLGYRGSRETGYDANDYDALRNSHYQYTLNIESVDNIMLEVDRTGEFQPGAEGAVILGNATYSFDAHYETKTITFSVETINDNLDWYVKTPFSEGFSKDKPLDKDWILFKLNSTRSETIGNGNNKKVVNYYLNNFARFPGEKKRFVGKSLEEFKKDTTMLLTVDQLLDILKECKKGYVKEDNKINSHLIDYGGNITFTAFINENYYNENPQDPNDKSVDLWKRFVNQPERIMNILSNQAYSPDGNSMMTRSVLSFRQASIQTMYNTELSADQLETAWGSEMIQDTNQYQFGTNNKYPTDAANGRQNCIQLWGVNINWSSYINSSDWSLKSGYRNAQYACLRLNRDNDGDGLIDASEIRWYLASINQLTDLWIGENSFDPAAKLYDKNEWKQVDQWYVSSTFSGRDNPIVLWSSEGSSIGPLTQITNYNNNKGRLYYRGVRNLGNVAEGKIPQDFALYDKNTGVISLEGLNYKSIRGYKTVIELPKHHEREADNMPRRRFEVQKGSQKIDKNWVEIHALVEEGKSPAKSLSGEGWRLPNQRELALMQSRIGGDNLWTSSNHMSRTRFSFNPTNGTRHGFSVRTNGSILYLINNNNEKGGVRCVRDLE